MDTPKKFKLPENNTGFIAVEIDEGTDHALGASLIFYHKDGYTLHVHNNEVVLNSNGNRIGNINLD
jgi:hypothetical protein